MKQDYLILLVALTIMGAGITDGLVRAFDLSVWIALPLVAVLWTAFAYTAYQRMVGDVAEDPDPSSA
ncbi:MAG: hypothetical protein GVY35_13930 [Bacteroidetes bacterium]|jgi:Ca2+/Na+ antiporter|nr:hypothetical protein [Bacteroidota bacterium]